MHRQVLCKKGHRDSGLCTLCGLNLFIKKEVTSLPDLLGIQEPLKEQLIEQ